MPKRSLRILCSGVLLAAGIAAAQTPAARLEFEVASIKPALPLATQMSTGKLHVGMTIDGTRVDLGSMSLADLVPLAFKVKPYQVSGPDWMSANRFDIIGKIPEGTTKDQVPEMLQALLADRFKLTFHRDSKDHPVYGLVVAKGGAKMKEAAPEPDAPPPAADDDKKGLSIGTADGSRARITQDSKGVVVTGNGQTGTTRMTPGPDGSMHMEASKMTMVALADALSRFVDRPVVDMTDLKGGYQVGLDLSMADLMKAARAAGAVLPPGMAAGGGPGTSPADAATDPSSGSIFNAVQQLGLRLEPRKTPIEDIVIDHLEKAPTEN